MFALQLGLISYVFMTNTLSVYDKQHSLICSTQFLNNLFGKHWEMKHFDSPVQLKTPNFLYYLGNTGQNRGSWNMRILGNSWFKISECFNYILLSSSSAQVCGTGVSLGLDFCFVATRRKCFPLELNACSPWIRLAVTWLSQQRNAAPNCTQTSQPHQLEG